MPPALRQRSAAIEISGGIRTGLGTGFASGFNELDDQHRTESINSSVCSHAE
jgi:hypothetical protein